MSWYNELPRVMCDAVKSHPMVFVQLRDLIGYIDVIEIKVKAVQVNLTKINLQVHVGKKILEKKILNIAFKSRQIKTTTQVLLMLRTDGPMLQFTFCDLYWFYL